jgi:hypothetical protein
MKKISFSEKFHYWFDNLMSKGPVAMMSLLAVISLFVVLLAGICLSLFRIAPQGESAFSFIEGAWRSLMRTLDPELWGEIPAGLSGSWH